MHVSIHPFFQKSITAMLSALRGEEERAASIKENSGEEPEDPTVSLDSREKTTNLEGGTEQYSVNMVAEPVRSTDLTGDDAIVSLRSVAAAVVRIEAMLTQMLTPRREPQPLKPKQREVEALHEESLAVTLEEACKTKKHIQGKSKSSTSEKALVS